VTTTPKIDIVDEKPGSASAIEALLGPSAPELADVKGSKVDNSSSTNVNAGKPGLSRAKEQEEESRVQQLIKKWNLPATLEQYRARGEASGTSTLEQAKIDARRAQATKGGEARAASASAKKTASTAPKASGKTYSTVRNLQTAQSLLAQKDSEVDELRAELERVKLENVARAARAQVMTEGEGLDELTEGFSAMLGFLFDGVSEVRRLHYLQNARAGGRQELTTDEQTAIAAWHLPDDRAESVARSFAHYMHSRLGPDMLELLPLFIGIAGIGGHVLHGVQAERMAKAEPLGVRVVR
jgi:hypothetical protein